MQHCVHDGTPVQPQSPDSIAAQFPQFPVTQDYPALDAALDAAAAKL